MCVEIQDLHLNPLHYYTTILRIVIKEAPNLFCNLAINDCNLNSNLHTHTVAWLNASVCLISEKRVIVFPLFIILFFCQETSKQYWHCENNHFLDILSHDWPTAADQRQGIGSRCFEPEMTNLGSDVQLLLPQTDWNCSGYSKLNLRHCVIQWKYHCLA